MSTPVSTVLQMPLSIVLQYCHAWQARQGANMRWVVADEAAMASTLSQIDAIINQDF